MVTHRLHTYFSQASLANATNLRFQLLALTKGSHSISDYLQQAKFIADSLAAINQPVSNNDLVSSVFKGYGPGYSMFVTAVINSPLLPNFPDLGYRLMTFEAQIKPDNGSLALLAAVPAAGLPAQPHPPVGPAVQPMKPHALPQPHAAHLPQQPAAAFNVQGPDFQQALHRPRPNRGRWGFHNQRFCGG